MGGKEDPPPEYQTRRGIVDWTDEPYSDLRLSPRACLNRQAGFTAARPAANWVPASAAALGRPIHSLEVSGRLSVARRVGEGIRRDADCGLEDWSGWFRPCVDRKIGRARRGSDPGEDRASEARRHWAPVSDMVPIPRSPVPALKVQRQRRSDVQQTGSIGRGVGASRETNRPRHKDPRSRANCNRRRRWRRRFYVNGGL